MTNILEISDGTTTINLLSSSYGFFLDSWNPQIAQAKRGGVYQSSSLSQGQKLVNRQFENIDDTFSFDIKGSGQPETILYVEKLINLLEQATEYWTGHADKVWLKAKADCEDNPRYALIVNYSWPELKFPYGSTFFTATEIASMINVDLGLEHGLWQATIPGNGDCVQASSVQSWGYDKKWIEVFDAQAAGGSVRSMLEARNASIYAGCLGAIRRSTDNGATWPVVTAAPTGGSGVGSIVQQANTINIFAADGGATEIYRSIDNGTNWTAAGAAFPVNANGFNRLLVADNSDFVYLFTGGGQIWRTTNNGLVWNLHVTVSGGDFTGVYKDFDNGDMYAATINNYLYKSIDDGVTWTLITIIPFSRSGLGPIGFIKTDDGNFITAPYLSNYEIMKSADAVVWYSIFQGETTLGASTVFKDSSGNIYVTGDGTTGRAIGYISNDNGINWQLKDLGAGTSKFFGMIEIVYGNVGDIYGGNTEIFRLSYNTNNMGRTATCNNEVYFTNKQNIGNLTHVKIDDGGVFTDIFPIAAYPQVLLPAVPAVNDAIYFGQDTTVDDTGIFDSLVFDIDTIASSTTSYTIVWEYWNGAWVTLTTHDNTDLVDVFTKMGVGSVHWEQPSDWATTAIDGITAYWVRARVSALTGTLTPPTQQNRDIYTIVLPYANIASTEILGNIPALLQQKLTNQSDEDGRGGNAPNLWDNRIICGLREYNRGVNFQAYLNIADEQNPIGVTVTATGANTTFQADTTAPAGRSAQYNPAGAEAMATQVTIVLGPSIARDFYGKFHAFLRVQRTAGAITDFDVQLQFVSGSGGIEFTTESKQVQTTTQFELLDFGQVQMPVGGSFKSTDLGDTTEIRVQASAASGTPNLNMYDLILIPVDEWSVDSVDFANSSDSIIGLDDNSQKFLDVDSITNPKIDIQSLVRLVGSEQITSVYDTVSPGHAVLQENKQQRLWFLAVQTSATGTSYSWISPPYIAHSIQLFKAERYLTFSKGS